MYRKVVRRAVLRTGGVTFRTPRFKPTRKNDCVRPARILSQTGQETHSE